MGVKLSSKDWELISAYVDDELNPREKARVEDRLKTHPGYKEALEGLHRTKAILQKTPVRKVPRNFTLTAADVQPVKVKGWIPTMQWSSVAVALVAVFLFAVQLVPGFSDPQFGNIQQAAQPEPTVEAMEMDAATAAAEPTPEVIYWGGPPLTGDMAFGMGGGAESPPVGGGGEGIQPGQMVFPQPPIPNPLPDLQADSTARATAAPSQPVTGSGPVLGVRPESEQGKALPETRAFLAAEDEQETDRSAQNPPWILGAAGGLLVIAIGMFVFAVIARRKTLS